MIATLILALAAGDELPLVYVRSPEGHALVDALRAPDATLVIPLATRSERVPRAEVTARGIHLRVVAPPETALVLGGLAVLAVEHAAEERLALSGGRPVLLGPPVLPRSIATPHAAQVLAFLARQDLQTVRGSALSIAPPAEHPGHLVIFGEERGLGAAPGLVRVQRQGLEGTLAGEEHTLPPGPHAALVLAAGRELVELTGDADQIYYAALIELPEARRLALRAASRTPARVVGATRWRGEGPPRPVVEVDGRAREALPPERLEALEEEPLRLSAGTALDLRVQAPPRAAEGRTTTLLLRLSAEAEPAGAVPGEAGSQLAAPDARTSGWFRDVTEALGIRCVHLEGPDEQLDIRPTMGPGAAWGDVDGDGWVDLYLVQGGGRAGSLPLPNRLLKNAAGRRFVDLPRESGAPDEGAGMGAQFLDLENDGDLDLYIANYGPDAVYRNDGAGRFEDVSGACGVGGERWSAGLAAADADRDGDLDLYVTSYLRYDLDAVPPAENLASYRREDPVEMLPFAFPGERNAFLRSDPGAEGAPPRLVDVAAELGLLDEQGRGMQPVFWDFDRDGDEDLYVANDVSFNVLFRNEGDGSFRDVSFQTGMDDPRGGMGVAIGDVDRDGDEDLFLTNWQLEANALYLNNSVSRSSRRHVGTFRDATVQSGLGPFGVGVTSWGAVLFDADCDGDLDLFVANGYTSPDYESTGICVGQPNHFFLGDGEGRFADATAEAGPALAIPLPSRAVAACDYDQDGDLDLLVTANNARTQLLRNEVPRRGRWLGVRLRSAQGNSHAIGARVTVRAGELELVRSLRAGTGYLSGNPPELHFGLGAVDAIEPLEVRWPSGQVSRHAVEGLDRFVTLVEP